MNEQRPQASSPQKIEERCRLPVRLKQQNGLGVQKSRRETNTRFKKRA